jgi:hypothetical protein
VRAPCRRRREPLADQHSCAPLRADQPPQRLIPDLARYAGPQGIVGHPSEKFRPLYVHGHLGASVAIARYLLEGRMRRASRPKAKTGRREVRGKERPPHLRQGLAGSAGPRRWGCRATVSPVRVASGSPDAGRGTVGTAPLVSLGGCAARVRAPRPGTPRWSSRPRPVPRDWFSLGAKRGAGALTRALAPSDRRSRLGRGPVAAQPSPGSGLSSSRRSSLRRVLPVWSFPLRLGVRRELL